MHFRLSFNIKAYLFISFLLLQSCSIDIPTSDKIIEEENEEEILEVYEKIELSRNYYLESKVILESSNKSISLQLLKNDRFIKELNRVSFGLPKKNLGYVAADFNYSFALVYSFGGGNGHYFNLIEKNSGEILTEGFYLDEMDNVLLYFNSLNNICIHDENYETEFMMNIFYSELDFVKDSLTYSIDRVGKDTIFILKSWEGSDSIISIERF